MAAGPRPERPRHPDSPRRNVVGDAGLQRASARADKGVEWWSAGSDHSCFARDLREIA